MPHTMGGMPVARVFSQAPFPPTSEAELVIHARAHFQADLAFTVRHFQPDGAYFRGTFTRTDGTLAFAVTVRRSTDADRADADAAEAKGRAGGMSRLARRCASLWEVDNVEDSPLDWLFLALLASVLLGPILPADGATLLGVRSARLRSEAAREPTLLKEIPRIP